MGDISLPLPWIPRNCCSLIRRPGSGMDSPRWQSGTYAGQRTANICTSIPSELNPPLSGLEFMTRCLKKWSALRTCVVSGALLGPGLDWDRTTPCWQRGISAVKRSTPCSGQLRKRHHRIELPSRSPRAYSYCVKRDLPSIQIKISFNLFIVESRSTKGSKPEPGCHQAESLAEMAGLEQNDPIGARKSIAPCHPAQHGRHHK